MQVAVARARSNKPHMKQNHSWRWAKGHQPCTLTLGWQFHCLWELGGRSQFMSCKSLCLTRPIWGHPWLCCIGQSTSLEHWTAQLPFPAASHFPRLPFRTAGTPCRQMGVKVICQSKITSLAMVHLFSVRIYIASMLIAWPLLPLLPLKLRDLWGRRQRKEQSAVTAPAKEKIYSRTAHSLQACKISCSYLAVMVVAAGLMPSG